MLSLLRTEIVVVVKDENCLPEIVMSEGTGIFRNVIFSE
jgi:hypothetical protein